MTRPRLTLAGMLAALGLAPWGLVALLLLYQGGARAQVAVKKEVKKVEALFEDSKADGEFTDRVRLPVDRQAKRKIDEARRLVEEEHWAEAARLLQSILDSKEDVFVKVDRLRDGKKESQWASVRTEANRILG